MTTRRIGWFGRTCVAAMIVTGGMASAAVGQEKAEPALPGDWLESVSWRSIGPANMSGRITSLAVYEKDPSIWWAASASGGLLKTENNGVTFRHQFDNEATVSIGQVAVAPSDPNIVWVGTGESNPRNSVSWGNGVYKSVDGGDTWTHMGLEHTFQTGAVVIHPDDPNVVYVGALGRLYGPNEDRGLYKTTDGGETWEKILYVNDETGVIDVDMNPSDPNELIVATYERQRDGFDTNDPAKKFGPGSGLYRTTDGGKNFEKLSKGLPSMNLGRIGVDYYRSNPDVIYAIVESEVIGDQPEDAPFLGLNGEDADVGARLTEVTDEGPAANAGLQTGDIVIAINDETVHSYNDFIAKVRRHLAGDTVTVEVSRDRQSELIDLTFGERPEGQQGRSPFSASLGGQQANLQDQQGPEGYQYGGLYRSDDGGTTWTRINSINPRPMYYSEVRVDPSDNNYIYVLGTSLHKSSDGGATFTPNGHVGRNGAVHVDHHAMWIDPDDGRHIILGNDGGVYVTYSRMMEWKHHNQFAIGQFYHVGVGPRRNYRVYGGLQDNGSWGGPSMVRNDGGPINEDWFRVGGGDGFLVLIDPEDPDQIYSESQNGGMSTQNLRTGERGFLRPRGRRGETGYRFNWKTPFLLSNHNSKIFYTAGNFVFKSLYKGSDPKVISPEITNTDRGSATALSESPRDADVMYVGTDDGALWVTRDGGATWQHLFHINGAPEADDASSDDDAGDSDDGVAAAEVEPPAQPEKPTQPKPDPGEDRVTGLWSGKATGETIPPDQGSFELELWLKDDGVVEGSLDSDVGAGPISDGSYDADTKALSFKFDGGGLVLVFTAQVGDNDSMKGTIGAEGADFEVDFTAERGANFLLTPSPSAAMLRQDGRDRRENLRRGRSSSRAEVAEQSVAVATAMDDPISGMWEAEADNPEMQASFEFTIELKLEDDGTVSGTVSSQMGDEPFSKGTWDEDSKELKFHFDSDDGMKVQFTCTVDGESMTGKLEVVDAGFGADFNATRTKKPEPEVQVVEVAEEAAREEAPRRPRRGQRAPRAEAAASSEAPAESGDEFVENTIDQLLEKPVWVSSIEASRFDDGRVYVTFDGHRSDIDVPLVFMSEDFGQTWTSLTTNLPDAAGSSRVIREDLENQNVLWLGCEFGGWVSIDRGVTWTSLSKHTNLPTVAVHEFALHRASGEVVAGTHGRSLWVLDAAPIRALASAAGSDEPVLLQPGSVIYWDRRPTRGNTMARFVGDNPSTNASFYYLLPGRARSISLEVQDMAGETIRELEVDGAPGMHRAAWDMRRAAPEQQGRRRRFGPRVPPGTYRLVLDVNGEQMVRTFEIEGDPERPSMTLWGEAYDEMLELKELIENASDDDGIEEQRQLD